MKLFLAAAALVALALCPSVAVEMAGSHGSRTTQADTAWGGAFCAPGDKDPVCIALGV